MGVKQDHADAFLALARTAPPSGTPFVVYDGAPPKTAVPPYAALYITTTRPNGTSLTNEQDEAVTRVICHSVAGQALDGDASAVRAVDERLAAAVLGVTLSIAGRSCWPIRDERLDLPPDRDDTAEVSVWTQRSAYRFGSVPA